MTYGTQQTQAPVEYEKVTRRTFTGRVINKPVVNTTQTGRKVTNVSFWIDDERYETGSEAAQITLWGDIAYTAAAFLDKNSKIIGSGVVKKSTYQNRDGETVEKLEFDNASIHLDLEQMRDLIRGEINLALKGFSPAPIEATTPATQPTQAPAETPTGFSQPPAAPNAPAQETAPELSVFDDSLPF